MPRYLCSTLYVRKEVGVLLITNIIIECSCRRLITYSVCRLDIRVSEGSVYGYHGSGFQLTAALAPANDFWHWHWHWPCIVADVRS